MDHLIRLAVQREHHSGFLTGQKGFLHICSASADKFYGSTLSNSSSVLITPNEGTTSEKSISAEQQKGCGRDQIN